MKKTLALSAVAVSTALILPNFVGASYQQHHQETMAVLGQNPLLSVKDYEFNRGWFSGTASTTLLIDTQNPEIEAIEIVVNEQLTFGPVSFGANGVHFSLAKSTVTFDSPQLSQFPELSQKLNKHINISSELSWLGNHSSMIETLAYQDTISEKRVEILPSLGEFTLSGNELVGEFNWQGLNIEGDDGHIAIAPVNISLDQTLIAGDLYSGNALATGEFSLLLNKVSFKDIANNQAVDLAGLSLKGMSSVDDNLMNISVEYHADEIAAIDKKITDANFVLSVNNLEVETIKQLNEMNRQLPTDTSDPAFTQMLSKAVPTAMKLLDHEPEIVIDELSVVTEQGKIESDANIRIDKSKIDPANPMSIMAALQVAANGKAPEDFFEQLGLKPMIDGYVSQGLLTRSSGELSFSVSFEQGQLIVNGQLMPL